MCCVFCREEIRELESKVQKERERYKLSTQTISGGFSAIPLMPINSAVRSNGFVFVLVSIQFDKMINDFFIIKKLSLTKDDASYALTIEIPAPIEFVLLQCNAPVELIDVEKSSAVVSFSQCDPEVCSIGNF